MFDMVNKINVKRRSTLRLYNKKTAPDIDAAFEYDEILLIDVIFLEFGIW